MSVKLRERDGLWFFRFNHEAVTYQKYGFKSQEEAKAAERQQIKDIETGKKPVAKGLKNLSFPEVAQMFYDEHVSGLKNEPVIRARLQVIMKHSIFTKRFIDVMKDDVKVFLNWLKISMKIKKASGGKIIEASPTGRTINHYRAHLHSLYEWAISEKDFNIPNPVRKVETEEIPAEPIRFLRPDEEARLTPVIEAHKWLWPYYLTALETGLRVSNLCKMIAKHIDLFLGQIFVPGAESKNGESGFIPISRRLMPWLTKWVEGKGPNDFVLGAFTRWAVSHRFMLLARSVGIDGIRFHDLRHTFATYHLLRGESIEHVSKLLLHKSSAVTQRHYNGILALHLRHVVDGGAGIITSIQTPSNVSVTPKLTPISNTNTAETPKSLIYKY